MQLMVHGHARDLCDFGCFIRRVRALKRSSNCGRIGGGSNPITGISGDRDLFVMLSFSKFFVLFCLVDRVSGLKNR